MKTAVKELDLKRAGKAFSRIFNLLADAVYPRECIGCGRLSDRPGRHICWSCFSRIDLLHSNLCELCGNPLTGSSDSAFICGYCRKRKPVFDRARSAARFSGVVRDILHQFKYQDGLWQISDLTDLLQGALMAQFDYRSIDVVVPVPLYRTRFRDRSYNQSFVLARELAKRIDRRVDGRSLKRVRYTDTQTHYNAAQRKKNISGAFSVVRPEWICGRTVLVVDDVMTTGATLNECAKILRKNGALKVFAISVARR
jgi:ComF family protein